MASCTARSLPHAALALHSAGLRSPSVTVDQHNSACVGRVEMNEAIKIYASLEEIEASGAKDVEYATIDGFKAGEKFRIGSVTSGDMIEWSEANEGEAKRTAGLRLITKSLVGPEPENVRYADDPKNIARLRVYRHKETERIVKEILKLNGMNLKTETDAKKD